MDLDKARSQFVFIAWKPGHWRVTGRSQDPPPTSLPFHPAPSPLPRHQTPCLPPPDTRWLSLFAFPPPDNSGLPSQVRGPTPPPHNPARHPREPQGPPLMRLGCAPLPVVICIPPSMPPSSPPSAVGSDRTFEPKPCSFSSFTPIIEHRKMSLHWASLLAISVPRLLIGLAKTFSESQHYPGLSLLSYMYQICFMF